MAWLAASSLGIAWLGCYVNLITERHWSSLRWLDPWELALSELEKRDGAPPPTEWVISQPAARYYFGLIMARRAQPDGSVRFDAWRRFAMPSPDRGETQAAATPESMLDRMKHASPSRLATIRGAEFADLPEWGKLQEILERDYRIVDEKKYLEDPDAKWKDRIDPAFKHPQWRIAVRTYKRRGR